MEAAGQGRWRRGTPVGIWPQESWVHGNEQGLQRLRRANFGRAMDRFRPEQRDQENRRRLSARLYSVSLQHGRPADPGDRHARGVSQESEFRERTRAVAAEGTIALQG